MIKNVCVLVSLIFAVSVGFSAEKSVKDLEAGIASVNAKKTQFAQDMATFDKQVDEATKKVQAAWKERNKAQAAFDDTRGGFLGFGRGTGDKDAKKNLDDAQAKFDAAKKTEVDSLKQRDELRKATEKLAIDATKDSNDLKLQNKAIATALSAQGVLMDFATLQAKLGDTDVTLEKLSNDFDKSLLGAYLKDKMGLLLNSQTMCEAVSRCTVKERKEVSAESIQKTLFPGTESSTRKGNLYDKSHGSGSGSTGENGATK